MSLNSQQIQTILNTHNNYRNNVNPPATVMPQLTWSDDLATNASKWAANCKFAHSGSPNVGENIYVTSMRTPNIAAFDASQAVNSWGGEKQYYSYGNCCPDMNTGHYTQIIWANTDKTGCAVQDCPSIDGVSWPNGGTLVVCQYSPPGNWLGQKPYQT